jgi:hypothetical protein
MAIKSQGTVLRIETARAATKVISGLTNANPGVVSAASNGYANGDIIYIDNVGGMTGVNKRAFVADTVAAGTFNLKGVNTTDTSVYAAYTSGGDSYKITSTAVAEVSGIDGFDGQANEFDVTNLSSIGKEYLLGLQDFGTVSFDVFLKNTDTGQAALRTAKESGAPKVFTITDSAGQVMAFLAYVKAFTVSATADDAVKGKVTLRITGAPSWFA